MHSSVGNSDILPFVASYLKVLCSCAIKHTLAFSFADPDDEILDNTASKYSIL